MALKKKTKSSHFRIELLSEKRKPFHKVVELTDRHRAKQIHDYISKLFFNTSVNDDRLHDAFETAMNIQNEMIILGITFVPKLGLVGNAKRIEAMWFKMDQLLVKMRSRGFGAKSSRWGV